MAPRMLAGRRTCLVGGENPGERPKDMNEPERARLVGRLRLVERRGWRAVGPARRAAGQLVQIGAQRQTSATVLVVSVWLCVRAFPVASGQTALEWALELALVRVGQSWSSLVAAV